MKFSTTQQAIGLIVAILMCFAASLGSLFTAPGPKLVR